MQKVQKTHPRAFGIDGHDIPDTRPGAQPRGAQNLAENACGLPSVCHDLRHPN
jgi:hypothetical protein